MRTQTRAILGASMVAGAVAAGALAAGPPSSLKATINGSKVTIANKSSQAFHGFFINSTDSPKITGSSDSKCKAGTSPWSVKGKKHTDYWLDCSNSLAAGKTLVINLKSSGHGTVFVWVKMGKIQYKIGQGG